MSTIHRLPGHTFLKQLGRSKLRPGGGVMTSWLFQQINWTSKMRVLEVACNQGDNLIHLYTSHHCQITGIDLDESVVAEAKDNLAILDLSEAVDVQVMSADNLAFSDGTFDVVINEAMLTMLDDKGKANCLKEYARVLKKGGLLLTHDVMTPEHRGLFQQILSRIANHHVYPLPLKAWQSLFQKAGFTLQAEKDGPMLLLDKDTVIQDEGPIHAASFFKNGLRGPHRTRFKMMQEMIPRSGLHYLVMVHQKI